MARNKSEIKNQVIESMESLGIFKPEYAPTIKVFVDMLHQYEVFTEEFESGGYEVQEPYTNKAGATNMRKTPVYAAIEKLRMDLSTYSNLLCLNPKSIENITAETQTTSKLASVLDRLE